MYNARCIRIRKISQFASLDSTVGNAVPINPFTISMVFNLMWKMCYAPFIIVTMVFIALNGVESTTRTIGSVPFKLRHRVYSANCSSPLKRFNL